MDARTRSHCVNLEVSFPLVLGARTTRPHRAGGAKSYPSSLHIRIIDSFALRAQCGRDVRAPRKIGLLPLNLNQFICCPPLQSAQSTSDHLAADLTWADAASARSIQPYLIMPFILFQIDLSFDGFFSFLGSGFFTGFGKGVGKGTGRTGKKVGKRVKHAFTP